MKSFILLYISGLLYLLSSPFPLIGQINRQKGAFFSGQVFKSQGVASSFDTLNVVYRTTYQPTGTKEHAFKIFADQNGKFSFELPYSATPIEMRFYRWYFKDAKIRVKLQGSFNLVEYTDRVKINIVETPEQMADEITFAGIGSEKYTVAMKLNELSPYDMGTGLLRVEAVRLKMMDSINFEDKLKKYQLYTYELLDKKKKIIKESALPDSMKSMLACNNGPILFEWFQYLTGIRNSKFSNNLKIRMLIKKTIKENINMLEDEVNQYAKYCPQYICRLASFEYQSLTLTRDASFQFQDLYHIFIQKYKGELRECLIANLFVGGSGWQSKESLNAKMIDSLRRDGLKYIIHANIKKAFEKRMRLNMGTPVYDGVFKDINGKEVKLSSLRGKVLFIDFWFTGCGACRGFHQRFHKSGFAHLKNESDFVYVSIGLDKDRDNWLKGINSAEYSSTDYLNLYSEFGNKHPFIAFYERAAFPFILVVDRDGKIFSSDIIPEPSAVVELIRSALKKTS